MISSAPIATTFSVKHARQCLTNEQPWLVAPWMPLDGLFDAWTALGSEVSQDFVQEAVRNALSALTLEHQALKNYHTMLKERGTPQRHMLLAATIRSLHEAVLMWSTTAVLLELAFPPETMSKGMVPFIAQALMQQLRVMTIAHAIQQEIVLSSAQEVALRSLECSRERGTR